MARATLDAARADVTATKAALVNGKPALARRLAHRLQQRADSAHDRTSGPAWWVAAQIPWLGGPVASVRDLTGAVDYLAAHALVPAVRAGTEMSPDAVLTGPGRLDLTRITAAGPLLTAAATAVDRVQRHLAAGPADTWLPAIDSKRADLLDQVRTLSTTLHDGATAAALLPPMLGANGPRHYFVAFENEAEARGLGGLPGSFGILAADHGRLHFTRFGADTDITAPADVHLGRAFDVRYGQTFHATSVFVNSTASPHFPYAAQIWMSAWENTAHQHLDGAIATDPTALGYLLGATGPVTLADGQRLDAANTVQVLENGIYAKFPDLTGNAVAERKTYLTAAARTIAEHITDHAGDNPHGVLDALRRAVDERRLLVYSARPDEQRPLSGTKLAGLVSDTTAPYAGVVINNAAGSKLDYYLDRSVTYQRSTCAATTSTVTVRLHNTAPASGLPPYVTIAVGPARGPLGQNYDLVSLYVTHGADVTSVRVDGRKAFIVQDSERGHPVISLPVKMPPGATRTITYRVREPAATGPVVVPVQPLVRPMNVTIRGPQCG